MTTPEDRLAALGIVLPTPARPIGNFVNWVRDGDQIFLSGQGPLQADGTLRKGKVGAEIGVEQAYQDARLTGINLLAVLREATDGDLSRVRRVVKLLGMVNAVAHFTDHPKVINGCSDLLIEVLGDAGRHARSAVGFASLPNNISVEIEAVVSLRDAA